MIAEYSMNLKNKRKDDLIMMIEDAYRIIDNLEKGNELDFTTIYMQGYINGKEDGRNEVLNGKNQS